MTTSFRMPPALQEQLRKIAAAERRTVNNWVRIILEDAVKDYLEKHPELATAVEDERA